MDLWLTAETRHDELIPTFDAACDIMVAAFNDHFGAAQSRCGLVELHFEALLHPPLMPLYGESIRYLRSLHAAFIRARVVVPLECDVQLMLHQLSGSLAFASARAQRQKIPGFDFYQFSSAFARFAQEQGWIMSGTMIARTALFTHTA
jgi:hypothetical protein